MTEIEKLYYHLEITPYLDLGQDFNPAPILEELKNYKEQFVVHRPEAQEQDIEGRWKGFSLQDKNSFLRNNSFTRMFPQTLSLLDACIQTDHASRIRFMMLEPHAKIKPHSDSPDEYPRYTFHACLTYPKGCEFMAGLNSKGEITPFSRVVPFVPGKTFLLNSSQLHYIQNDSPEERIHLVALAVPKMSMKYLLERAIIQNGDLSEEELLKQYAKVKLCS